MPTAAFLLFHSRHLPLGQAVARFNVYPCNNDGDKDIAVIIRRKLLLS
jgi:hypothetical protein